MELLTQFLFRVSFGLAAAMACVSPRQVTSGYFRNHLYVVMGLDVLAALLLFSRPELGSGWLPTAAAILSYVGAVAWLYEQRTVGRASLVVVAGLNLYSAWIGLPPANPELPAATFLRWLDPIGGGLTLGGTMAAMLLGHWYLNTPTMKLAPLKRLVQLMAVAVLFRAIVCGTGLALTLQSAEPHTLSLWFVVLRWLSGIVGALVVAWMTWETLKIPNTQSATGILYVGVIVTFLGELVSLLMSPAGGYPL